jgi:hypothetical protein
MFSNPADSAARRAAYERQLALLVPVAGHLRDAAAAPGVLLDAEWRGPAADAAHRFERELRAALGEAAESVDDETGRLRHLIAAVL